MVLYPLPVERSYWMQISGGRRCSAPPDRVYTIMTTAKTTTERVAAMRAARDAFGLRRLELYAHPDDWPQIKALAEKLQRRRDRAARKK